MAKDYIRPMSKHWWMERKGWRWFMLREWTCVFVAAYALFLLWMAARAGSDGCFACAFDCMRSPWSLVFHVPVLVMVTFHTVTWFAAAPKALRIYRGEERVPPKIVAGAHFAAWIVVSIIVAWIVLG
jgi:fumarate reductase subunit C